MTCTKRMGQLSVMGILLGEPKYQVGTYPHGESLSVWLLKVNINLMVQNQALLRESLHIRYNSSANTEGIKTGTAD